MGNFPRSSGIILPIFALPSPYGIGTLGACAFEFADFLKSTGQTFWQMLPLGQTSHGDSPYQSFSSFAGNPYFIDLDLLIADNLLTSEEVSACDFGTDDCDIDYEKIYNARYPLLRMAFERGKLTYKREISDFVAENSAWISGYAVYMASKLAHDMRAWYEWEDDKYSQDNADFYIFLQFLFFKQWKSLKAYCAKLGIKIIGDLPIYTAMDSADVWANPELFCLSSQNIPTVVAGVPPDYFSEDGQLWGNPIYDWDKMREDNFAWWRNRITQTAKLFDVIRIDHFRGLESFWAVPYGETTAVNGSWVKGPDREFIDAISELDVDFIAEDLGIITDAVTNLREYAKMPGMAVLQFAFDPNTPSSYLPHNLVRDCILYTGTHDNNTLAIWLEGLSDSEREFVAGYCGDAKTQSIIRAGMVSIADVFITQMQDWISGEAVMRTNEPNTTGENWRFRLPPNWRTDTLCNTILNHTKIAFRTNKESEVC